MKKHNEYNNIKIITKYVVMLTIVSLIYSCDYFEGIRNEAKYSMQAEKDLVKEMSFSGKVKRKIYKSKRKNDKYHMLIITDSCSINYLRLSSYYQIRDSSLEIVVNKEIYDLVVEGDSISKTPNSYNIVLKNKKIPLISKNKDKWYP